NRLGDFGWRSVFNAAIKPFRSIKGFSPEIPRQSFLSANYLAAGTAALQVESMTKHPKEADRLRKIVDAFPKVTVTVLGDLVADEFIFGEISRVSREAPVLILKHRDRTVLPGGGANAVNNLADLGVNVLPVGIVGDDEPGRLLLKYFRHKRIALSGVLKDKSYTT